MQVRVQVIAVIAGALLACQGGQPLPPAPPNAEAMFLSGACPKCCPDWGCGTNGAWLGQNVVFHELDGSGAEANRAGLRVAGFSDGNSQPLELKVDRDRLHGVRAGGVDLTGAALIGATIELVRGGSPTAATVAAREVRYQLTIVGYATTAFWVDPVGDQVPVYAFTFQKLGVSKPDVQPLCRDPADGGTRWQPITGMAVIFSGDRYDERTKVVHATGAGDPWFNIACAGTTVAKMHLLRHTWASDDGAHATTVADRQAVLKMLTADYCGTGKPFTVDGHPLDYGYAQPWDPPVDWAGAASLDAVWTADHAACLNVPRLRDAYANIRSKIVAQCGAAGYTLKTCGPDLMPALKQLAPDAPPPWPGYAVSINPGP